MLLCVYKCCPYVTYHVLTTHYASSLETLLPQWCGHKSNKCCMLYPQNPINLKTCKETD